MRDPSNSKLETHLCVPKHQPLFNFEPPATDDEVRLGAQFDGRSAANKPSNRTRTRSTASVDQVTETARKIESLLDHRAAADREEVAAKARERAVDTDAGSSPARRQLASGRYN
jgi:hypothetical protein